VLSRRQDLIRNPPEEALRIVLELSAVNQALGMLIDARQQIEHCAGIAPAHDPDVCAARVLMCENDGNVVTAAKILLEAARGGVAAV